MKRIVGLIAAVLIGYGHTQSAKVRTSSASSLSSAGGLAIVSSDGYGTVSFQVTGTWSGTLKFEGTNNSTWVTIQAANITTGLIDTVATSNGVYVVNSSNVAFVRVRMATYTSGTAVVLPVSLDPLSVSYLFNPGSGGGGPSENVAVTSFPDNEPINTAQWGGSAVTGGAGAVAAGTPRVTLASDDPAVAALQILDNAISGSEMQVDVVTSALPTGAATAANQTTGNGHLSTLAGAVKAEDAAHSSGDAGVPALAVRADADASLAGATGDYTPLQVDDNGFLKVNIKAGAGSGGDRKSVV